VNCAGAGAPFISTSLVDVLPATSAERIDEGNGRSAVTLYMSSQATVSAISK
jgi:hypothetical protein